MLKVVKFTCKLKYIDSIFYTIMFRKYGFRCQVSGKVDAKVYPEH